MEQQPGTPWGVGRAPSRALSTVDAAVPDLVVTEGGRPDPLQGSGGEFGPIREQGQPSEGQRGGPGQRGEQSRRADDDDRRGGGDGEEPVDLLEVVELLRVELGALRLPLAVPGGDLGRTEREALMAQLDDYLLPRLRRMDAPVLAVVGGSTGAGKSTLVNSLVRREVTRSGVLRPTTRSPVLVHHPYDSGAFLSQRILPSLARVTSEAPEPGQPQELDGDRVTALRLVPHEGMPPGIAIVDAPDIDSLVDANRELAAQLLAAADLWIFVTTAARYGDAVPWEMLKQAVDRGASVAVVLDRVPPEAMAQVRAHLATLLRDRGLATAPLFTIAETERTFEGFLPQEIVQPLLGWLTRLSRDARSRDVVVRRTLVGALDSLRERLPVIAAAADAQVAADERLRDELDDVYATATDQLEQRLCDGTLIRGEVRARWQGFVGTGDVFRSMEATVARLRDRLGAERTESVPTSQLEAAIESGARALIRACAQSACDDALLRWRSNPEGAALLDGAPGPTLEDERLAPDFDVRLAQQIRDWQLGVLDLVRGEGLARGAEVGTTLLGASGSASRTPSADPDEGAADVGRAGHTDPDGLNGPAVILMLAVCSHTARANGTERGVEADTAAAAARVLEVVFGEQAVRTLVDTARGDLLARAGAMLDGERSRVEALLDTAGVRDGRGETLRAIGTAIEEAR